MWYRPFSRMTSPQVKMTTRWAFVKGIASLAPKLAPNDTQPRGSNDPNIKRIPTTHCSAILSVANVTVPSKEILATNPTIHPRPETIALGRRLFAECFGEPPATSYWPADV